MSRIRVRFTRPARRRAGLASAIAAVAVMLTAMIAAPAGAVTFGGSATLASGLTQPQGIAADADGNVFVADRASGQLFEIPPGCATSSCQVQMATDLGSPTGVAVDPAGDVYVARADTGNVIKFPAGCVAVACSSVAASGFVDAAGIVVDGSGTIFAAIPTRNIVMESTAACAGGSQCTVTMGGFNAPQSVDLAFNGDVVVANAGAGQVLRLTQPECADASCGTPVPLSIEGAPTAVTHDNAGDEFVAVYGNGVIEIPSGCWSPSCERPVTTQQTIAYGIATDPSANLYVADIGRGRATEYRSVLPSGTLSIGASTLEPGDTVTVTSTTPCPAPAGTARVELVSAISHRVAGHSSPVAVDSGGNWQMTYTVPPGTPRGSYGLTGQCVDGAGSYVQAYAFANIIVPGISTTTSIMAPKGATFGQSVRIVATVAPAIAGAGPVTGTVTFTESTYGTPPVIVSVDAQGQAVLTTSALAVGSHSFTATYNGDPLYFGSQSGSTDMTVNKAATKIVPYTASKKAGSFKARLMTASYSPVPIAGETLVFATQNPLTKAWDTVCSGVADANGYAICTGKIPTLDSMSDHTYRVTYAGSADYIQSAGTGTLGN